MLRSTALETPEAEAPAPETAAAVHRAHALVADWEGDVNEAYGAWRAALVRDRLAYGLGAATIALGLLAAPAFDPYGTAGQAR